jgi:RNA ligase (TIGR02306 family)
MRGEYSQGLVTKPEVFGIKSEKLDIGKDFTKQLGIKIYDPEIRTTSNGEVLKQFPEFIHKTQFNRIQNINKTIKEIKELKYEKTEKLDGSSLTMYIKGNKTAVCSRNLERGLFEKEQMSFLKTLWTKLIGKIFNYNKEKIKIMDWYTTVYFKEIEKLEEWSKKTKRNIAIQGEIIGPGIASNHYCLTEKEFLVFDIWDIDTMEYIIPSERRKITKEIGLNHVPVFDEEYSFTTVEDELKLSDGKSKLNKNVSREGFVFKSCSDPRHSFKIVSNKYLMKK